MLGGSTPFTVGLIDAIDMESANIRPAHLVLHGRSAEAISLVAAYARGALVPRGWRVSGTTKLSEALDGADIVVHQIRYGGLEGRRRDEWLASQLGLPADETIGPAGLAAALRMAPGHRVLARALIQRCPDALVLNLTNPLSCSTALLHRWGVPKVVGLCELPLATAREACDVLGLQETDIDWTYAGLNHRGFIHRLTHRGRDLMNELLGRLGDQTIGGIGRAEIASLGAIPMKHFALFRSTPARSSPRAEILLALRRNILDELRNDATRPPPSLRVRHQPWYRDAVVPMLIAIDQTSPRRLIVNLPAEDDVVHELPAAVSEVGVEPTPDVPPLPAVVRWIDRFVEHERRVVAAAMDPSPAAIRAAVDSDPLVRRPDVEAITRRVCEEAVASADRSDAVLEHGSHGQPPAPIDSS